jgi:hypothetical protein
MRGLRMNRIEKFQLQDQDGNIYTAVKITPKRKLRGSNELIEGLPTYQLSDGEHLNPHDDGFKAIHSGLVLKHLKNR